MTARKPSSAQENFSLIPPGLDAWLVGSDPCVVIDWQGFADYARR